MLEALRELRQAVTARRSTSVELVARSNFSFLSGASSPEALVERAAALGYDTLGVCDLHGLYGIVRANEAAKKLSLRLVVGVEIMVPSLSRLSSPRSLASPGRTPRVSIALHVQNRVGYKNLCRILSRTHALRPRDDRAATEVPLSFLCENAAGLFATLLEPDKELAEVLVEAFGPRASVAAVLRKDGLDRERMVRVADIERTFAMPVVATNRVLFARREDKPILDVLQCIRDKTTLEQAGRALLPNAEAHLKPEEEMQKLFSAHPGWLGRSRAIADACTFSLSELDYRFPSDSCLDAGETPDIALRRLTHEGARARYEGKVPPVVLEQIEKELALIERLEVAPYFLSVRQIVDMARRRDILCQGRGSAANSAVCFCLGITAIDPARSSLLFERFLSAERKEPPDIDVDFEHERREEIIQEIYETWGRDRAAMVSEIITYRGKSALREVGKVFGLSLEQIDRLCSLLSWDGVHGLPSERLVQAGFDPADERVIQVLAMARALRGYPRHLSIHVGGFVLSGTPLEQVAPIEPASMEERTIIPWDKDDLDALGFFKIDVLALGMLTAIHKALDLVKDAPIFAGAKTAMDRLARIPAEDPLVYDALCKADTVGVFQIESRAQMAMLPRLLPRCFYDLVVEVALVRPGPIQGGMVHPYLRRRSGEEPADPPHPLIGPILERTLGVPLFQEQVMQIAIVGAGYTGGEADQLRRDMAAWKKHGGLHKHEERLAKGFARNGISQKFSEQLYAQIKGFGEYGFPESHAASFALLVYVSAWLKVHHPAAFAAALVNSQPMGFYSASTLLEDAKRHGVQLQPVCVQESSLDTTCRLPSPEVRDASSALEGSPPEASPPKGTGELRIGLRKVRGLPSEAAARIVAAQPFSSIQDLEERADLRKDELFGLAEAGALGSVPGGEVRRQAMWTALAPRSAPLFSRVRRASARRAEEAAEPEAVEPESMPLLPALSRTEQLLLDYERTGHSVADHPMRLVRERLPLGVLSSRDLLRAKHGAKVTTAGVVLCRQRPATASGVVFLTLEDEFGFVNLVVFSKIFERQRQIAVASSMLLVTGKVERQAAWSETPVVYVVAEKLERLSLRGKKLPSMSRDFR